MEAACKRQKTQKPPGGDHEFRHKLYLAVAAALAREALLIVLREFWPRGPA